MTSTKEPKCSRDTNPEGRPNSGVLRLMSCQRLLARRLANEHAKNSLRRAPHHKRLSVGLIPVPGCEEFLILLFCSAVHPTHRNFNGMSMMRARNTHPARGTAVVLSCVLRASAYPVWCTSMDVLRCRHTVKGDRRPPSEHMTL